MPTILCVNKCDLPGAEPEAIQNYEALGLPVLRTSCQTGEGIEILHAILESKTSVLAGQSGVGKTSLLNALEPGLELDTGDVSETTGKGRHTTSASRMYHLGGGIQIIDTPGIRQIGLWGISPHELDVYFPEIARLAAQCRFRDCSHEQEPGCAVREALEAGQIAPLRFTSFQHIRESLGERFA